MLKMAEEKSNFKWNNRKKATETAVTLKVEEKLTPEAAVERVMAEYEGVYFVNGKEISEKRFNNFIARVEAEKKYKASKTTPTEVELSQTKIKALLDKGELTDLQAKVLESVYNQLASYVFGTSDVTLADVAEDSGLKKDRIKGALGHLIKKGFLRTEEITIGEEKVNAIFIEKQELFNDDLIKYQNEMEEAGEDKPKGNDITPEDIRPEAVDLDEDAITQEEMEKVMAELHAKENESVV
jgi:DNA-binding MarR family transcriptional regulator